MHKMLLVIALLTFTMLSSIVISSYSSLLSCFESIEFVEDSGESKDKLETEKKEDQEVYANSTKLILDSKTLDYHFLSKKVNRGFQRVILNPPII